MGERLLIIGGLFSEFGARSNSKQQAASRVVICGDVIWEVGEKKFIVHLSYRGVLTYIGPFPQL